VDVYPDYADYQRKTDRQIPVFVLEPVSRPAADEHDVRPSSPVGVTSNNTQRWISRR